MLETDHSKARAAAREYMKFYLTLPAYQKNLGALGFNQTDLANGGSDRLVDVIVAWGDETNLRTRVEAHYKAGANHVVHPAPKCSRRACAGPQNATGAGSKIANGLL